MGLVSRQRKPQVMSKIGSRMGTTLTCTSATLVGYMWLSPSQVSSAAPTTISSGTVAWERLARVGGGWQAGLPVAYR
jgi:hypothetical protein